MLVSSTAYPTSSPSRVRRTVPSRRSPSSMRYSPGFAHALYSVCVARCTAYFCTVRGVTAVRAEARARRRGESCGLETSSAVEVASLSAARLAEPSPSSVRGEEPPLRGRISLLPRSRRCGAWESLRLVADRRREERRELEVAVQANEFDVERLLYSDVNRGRQALQAIGNACTSGRTNLAPYRSGERCNRHRTVVAVR